jgi:hypothetical protein
MSTACRRCNATPGWWRRSMAWSPRAIPMSAR